MLVLDWVLILVQHVLCLHALARRLLVPPLPSVMGWQCVLHTVMSSFLQASSSSASSFRSSFWLYLSLFLWSICISAVCSNTCRMSSEIRDWLWIIKWIWLGTIPLYHSDILTFLAVQTSKNLSLLNSRCLFFLWQGLWSCLTYFYREVMLSASNPTANLEDKGLPFI